jgi:Ca-activated chloride channel homolog
VLKYQDRCKSLNNGCDLSAPLSFGATSTGLLISKDHRFQGGWIMPKVFLFVLIFCITAAVAFPQTGGRTGAPTLKGGSTPTKRPPAITNQVKPPISTKPATEEAEVVTVETNLIQTPVSVLDRNGRFIPGLKKKDFKIFENGIQQNIELFQSSEQPFTVVLMIDTSPSTRYKIDEIHYAAITFVNQLRPADRVMVVAFDQRPRILCEPTTDKQLLYSAIYKANFGSGTSLYDAVDAVANSDLIAESGRKAIVIFTDGVDTTSRRASFESSIAGVEEIDALIYPIRYNTIMGGNQQNLGIDPKLFAQLPRAAQEMIMRATSRNVGRGQSAAEYERGRQYLEALATYSGGRLFDSESLTNLEAAFSGVAEELRRQYSVGYYSNNEGQPGDRKQIKITVARPKVVVRSKTTYVVKEKPERNDPPTISE